MWVYIAGFTLSVLLLMAMPKIKKTQQKYIAGLAIIIPCIIAALRANTVGTDVQVYLEPMVDAALKADSFFEYYNSSWWMSWRYLYTYDYEIGFVILAYTVTKLFGSIYFVQFFIQLLTILPIYVALKKNKNVPAWIGILTYFLLFYNVSLNAMRQYIAMAFCYLAMQHFREGEIKKYALFQIIASLFHVSSIMCIAICVMRMFVCGYSWGKHCIALSAKEQRRRLMVAVLVGLAVLLGAEVIAKVLMLIGLGKFSGYISGDLAFMPNQIIIRLPILVMCILSWRKLKRNDNDAKFLLLMLIYVLILTQFTSANSFAGRISGYFELFYLELLPQIYCMYRKKSTGKPKFSVYSALVLGYMAFYWWFFYVYGGCSATVPYVSIWG